MLPNRKVGTAAFAGALSAVLMWLLDEAGVSPPHGIEAAITTLIMCVVGYLTPLPKEA